MTALGPSTSPQWDSRNRGFISPSQLQQMKRASLAQSQSPPPPQSQTTDPVASTSAPNLGQQQQQQQPQKPALLHRHSQSHSRATSFFSFRSRTSLDGQREQPTNTSGANAPQPPPPNPRLSLAGPSEPPAGPMQPSRQPTVGPGPTVPGQPPPPPLHAEIRSVVQLTVAHAHKVYFSGPLVRRIERQPDGQKPAKDEGWQEVWAQLGGTTLSIWDMKKIEEASREGREVPPTYVNVTDAFVQVLGAVTLPSVNGAPGQRYQNVITLNTAGSNLLLFSCPSPAALVSWAAALRLTAWEKSRLEEIYTAHLIRITLNDGRKAPSPLVGGRMEGWVRIRLAGQTDWKRLWMVLTAGTGGSGEKEGMERPASPSQSRKRRVSNIFSRDHDASKAPQAAPLLALYASQKPKDRKRPLLTMRAVSQAFAVYPERPELISRSTLMKLEGLFGDEDTAAAMRGREGWILVMPELEGGNTQASEMLKWMIGIHDAFELYGRPKGYTWDPRDPVSMMFAYPVGPDKDLLFLDREVAEALDPRDDRTSSIRTNLRNLMAARMTSPTAPDPRASGRPNSPPRLPPPTTTSPSGAPTLPPIGDMGSAAPPPPAERQNSSGMLPPLSFQAERAASPPRFTTSPQMMASSPPPQQPPQQPVQPLSPTSPHSRGALTPITERSLSQSWSGDQHGAPGSGDQGPSRGASGQGRSSTTPATVLEEKEEPETTSFTKSPSPVAQDYFGNARPSADQLSTRPSTDSVANRPSLDSLPSRLVSPSSPHGANGAYASSFFDRPRSPASVLTSPYSNMGHSGLGGSPQSRMTAPGGASGTGVESTVSLVTQTHGDDASRHSLHATLPLSPRSQHSQLSAQNQSAGQTQPPQQQQPRTPSPDEPPPRDLFQEAGALYYMRQMDEAEGQAPAGTTAPRFGAAPPPSQFEEDEDEDEEDDRYRDDSPTRPPAQIPPRLAGSTSPGAGDSQPPRRGTPMGFERLLNQSPAAASDTSGGSAGGHRTSLAHRPSGARAPPTSTRRLLQKEATGASVQPPQPPRAPSMSTMTPSASANTTESESVPTSQSGSGMAHKPSFEAPDDAADVLAALNFLEQEQHEQQPAEASSPPPPGRASASPPPPQPKIVTPVIRAQSPESPDRNGQYRSSFAPSKTAAERKARAQAQQAAHEAAVHKPGRVNGKRAMAQPKKGGWAESSEEEEEEDEDEDDEEVDSDAEPQARRAPASVSEHQPSTHPSIAHGQSGYSPAGSSADLHAPRAPRHLPQVPGSRVPMNGSEEHMPMPPRSRMPSDQMTMETGRRTHYEEPPRMQAQQQHLRPHSEYPNPGATRQSIWTQVLEPGKPAQPTDNGRDTFVQIEAPEQTMTKAFTPHGLLSAGLQDKQDRSAKRQEELARETGASLVNVEGKPPPPQAGLLGAITAHERERKREGGFGAALTEREREKRAAEERQRKLDEFQRQQLEQMQQGGSMYGAPGGMGMNPMMGNPMMMGMNPMMSGFMGYPGMMPGFNPQHMFAAQQAAQAYQQAMMAFSMSGSQMGGGDAGSGGPPGQIAPMNPMMTGMSGMGAFDPRMSMMGMPPMMGGAMSPMPMGMSMQMTGGSTFQMPFQQGQFGDTLTPQGNFGGPGPSRFSPQGSLNASPAQRPQDPADEPPPIRGQQVPPS